MPSALLLLGEMALNATFIAGFILGARVTFLAHDFIKKQLS